MMNSSPIVARKSFENMGASDVVTASLRKHRSEELQRLLLEHDTRLSKEDQYGTAAPGYGGQASPNLRAAAAGRETPSRYQSATVSSTAQRRFMSPVRSRMSPSSSSLSPNREKITDLQAALASTAAPSSVAVFVEKRRPWPSSGSEHKTPNGGSSDVAPKPTHDRRRLPARASFDGGLWPSTNGFSSSLRLADGGESKPNQEGDGSIDQINSATPRRLSLGESSDHRSNDRNPLRVSMGDGDIYDQHGGTSLRPSTEAAVGSHLAVGSSTPERKLESPDTKKTPSSKQYSTEQLGKLNTSTKPHDRRSRAARREKVEASNDRNPTNESPERETLAPLGKQLGEHFENLDSSLVRQLIRSADHQHDRKKKNENERLNGDPMPRKDHRQQQVENAKPVENLNLKPDQLQGFPGSATKNPINSIGKKSPSSSSSSLSRVASLLVPSRYKNYSKKVDKTASPLGLSRSSSYSSSTALTGPSAKVARCLSLDGREAKAAPKTAKKGDIPADGGAPSDQAAERVCRSFNGFEPIDRAGAGASDTESSSSGGSAVRMARLNSRSWTTEGDGVGSPASLARRLVAGSGSGRWSTEGDGVASPASYGRRGGSTVVGRSWAAEADGVASPASYGRRSSNGNGRSWASPAAGWEAAPRNRRAQVEAALDLALLLNRCLQWRFLNAGVGAATQAQAAAAESSLCNACMSLFKLRASVATQQMLLQKATQQHKLHSILLNMGGSLETWDSLQQKHSSSVKSVIGALETTMVSVPIVGGVQMDVHSMKDALGSALSIMNGVDFFAANLLPQVEIVDSLLSELAETVVLEKGSLEELNEVIAAISTLEMEERSLRASLMQAEREKSHPCDNKSSFNPLLVC